MAGTEIFEVFQHVNIQSAVLFGIILWLCSYLFTKNINSAALPPGPKGWPVLGNLLSMSWHSEREMYEWNKKYGPVCRLKLASIEMILLGSVEAVEEAFTKKCDIFSDRLQNTIAGMSGDGGIIFRNYGIQFKEQRRFGISTLREFGMGRRSLEPRILQESAELCDEIEIHSEKGQAFTVNFMVYQAISTVISRLVFNKDLPKENPEFRDFLKFIISGSKYSDLNFLTIFFPRLSVIPPFSWGAAETEESEKKVSRMIQKEIDYHDLTRDPEDPRDYIDCFLNKMNSNASQGSQSFTNDQLNTTVRDLFLAGSETTSTAICWTILFLSRDQSLQARLHDEIDEVLGHAKHPSISIVDKMPFTRAVIQETLRIRPVAPVGVPHVATRDGTIMGYGIPKGAVVVANLFRIQNDENVWPNPDKFNPYRHLDSEGNFLKSPFVIPFSSSARQCLGLQLASMELFLVIASVFQKFSFKTSDGESIDMRGINVFTLRPYPFKVFAKKR